MSMETRSSSALFKRAEQLRRWEESETSRESSVVKSNSKKIKFSSDCVFLAACAAGDKDEVERLIEKGADIDTANVDGLTSLHQACIDDNLDMVEFLVSLGADVNRGDNEGWTPLHATASCGFISIAKYLIENGGDVAAVNNDGDLPVDIAESDAMEELLQQHLDESGINYDEARREEERIMLSDAKEWASSGETNDTPHPKTGATALHVAAAKGYIKVLDVLLDGGLDVNVQDFDGWTPLHAAAHWGQKESCEKLVEHFCDMNIKNYVGQTPFDVADNDMVKTLEDLRKKQNQLQKERDDIKSHINKKSVNNQPNKRSNNRDVILEKTAPINNKDIDKPTTQTDPVPKVKVEIKPQVIQNTDDTVEKKNKANRDEPLRIPFVDPNKTVPNNPQLNRPSLPPPKGVITMNNEDANTWRRTGSFRNRGGETTPKNLTLRIGEKEVSNKLASPTGPPPKNLTDTSNEISLRRTQSFEADDKRGLASREDRLVSPTSANPPLPPGNSITTATTTVTITTVSSPATTGSVSTTVTTTSPHNASQVRSGVVIAKPSTGSGANKNSNSSPTSTASTPTTPGASKLSPGNIFKNFFKSFVPPVRDEESETQRKAHAKRVRETRRSTQGVTLEEIKSAEQLVKKKQQQQLQQLNSNEQPDEVTVSLPYVTATIKTGEPTTGVVTGTREGERRPSWRIIVDNGSKFLLEDARTDARVNSDPIVPEVTLRKFSNSSTRPASAPVTTANSNSSMVNNNNNKLTSSAYSSMSTASTNSITSNSSNSSPSSPIDTAAETTVTLPLRRPNKLIDDKEDKENDIRNAQATQAVISRRRRPKRRSTGVVHVDMDEIDPDRQEGSPGGGGDVDDNLPNDSGNEGTSRLRLSTGSGDRSSVSSNPPTTENGELDYKKLYEQSQLENEMLREKLRKTEQDLLEIKSNNTSSKVTPSEIEKRERRAMERKLSEMEEELKHLEQLRNDNQKLKDENGALIRVISKLSK